MYVCLWLDWSWGWAYALYKWWCCSFLVHWRVVWVLRCCCCCCCYSQLFVVVVAWLLYVGRFCCWNAADKWVLAFLLKRRGKMCVDLHTNKHSQTHTQTYTYIVCHTHLHWHSIRAANKLKVHTENTRKHSNEWASWDCLVRPRSMMPGKSIRDSKFDSMIHQIDQIELLI